MSSDCVAGCVLDLNGTDVGNRCVVRKSNMYVLCKRATRTMSDEKPFRYNSCLIGFLLLDGCGGAGYHRCRCEYGSDGLVALVRFTISIRFDYKFSVFGAVSSGCLSDVEFIIYAGPCCAGELDLVGRTGKGTLLKIKLFEYAGAYAGWRYGFGLLQRMERNVESERARERAREI